MSTVRTSTVRRRTDVDAVQTLRLAHEAVELPHLPDAGAGPALGRDDGVNLIAKGLNVLCVCRKVVESVSDALPRAVSQSQFQCEAHRCHGRTLDEVVMAANSAKSRRSTILSTDLFFGMATSMIHCTKSFYTPDGKRARVRLL